MEVVPTGDGEEDDGVIWFRCPQCQGFLPKLSGADLKTESPDKPADPEPAGEPEPDPSSATVKPDSSGSAKTDGELPWDSPADMMKARHVAGDPETLPELDDLSGDDTPEPAPEKKKPEPPQEPAEPIHEYAAMLEAKDQSEPSPYRPWETYEVGQCIHHQAWEDCGVVVAKEDLPGGRQVIKCYFAEAGVVRLIEKAPR
ncbi:MAG: hypothetical protein ABFS42_03100 [Candidatus Krumholzibacteriota bacterium]